MIKCVFENGNKASLRHAVVDVLIFKEDKLLLIKRAGKLLEGGKWALVGGYVERDENLKEAAKREILEESGYHVKDLQIFAIIDNPDRRNEDRQNISFVFICTATTKVGESDWEVDDQQWYSLSKLPPEEQIAFDHSKLIELYQEFKSKQLSLPIFK